MPQSEAPRQVQRLLYMAELMTVSLTTLWAGVVLHMPIFPACMASQQRLAARRRHWASQTTCNNIILLTRDT